MTTVDATLERQLKRRVDNFVLSSFMRCEMKLVTVVSVFLLLR